MSAPERQSKNRKRGQNRRDRKKSRLENIIANNQKERIVPYESYEKSREKGGPAMGGEEGGGSVGQGQTPESSLRIYGKWCPSLLWLNGINKQLCDV